MRILVLPNFDVMALPNHDESVRSPNRFVDGQSYWFFSHMPDIKVDVIDNSAPFPFGCLSRSLRVEILQALRAIVVQNEYDIVLSHSYNSGFVFSFLRSLLKRKTPRHYVIDVGSLNGGVEDSLQIKLIKFALQSVTGVIYHSRICEEFYSRHFHDLKRVLVHFGVDTDFFAPLDSEPTMDYALSIGYAKRDYATLIRAWREVDFPLKIVGMSKRKPWKHDNVEYCPRVSIKELKELIHNAGFVILPIENVRHSTGQTTLLQCMSMCKPVIVTRAFGILDYVTEDYDCMIVENNDERDIIEKIRFLMNDSCFARMISINARKTAVEKFNERRMAMDIHGFLVSTNDSIGK